MNISNSYATDSAASVFATTQQTKSRNSASERGGSDSVNISDEARALFAQQETNKKKMQNASAGQNLPGTSQAADSSKDSQEIPNGGFVGVTWDIHPPQMSTESLDKSIEKTRKLFKAMDELDEQLLRGKIKKQEYDRKITELTTAAAKADTLPEELEEANEYMGLLKNKYDELIESYKNRFGDDFDIKNLSSEQFDEFQKEFYKMVGSDSRITSLMDSLGIDKSKLSS